MQVIVRVLLWAPYITIACWLPDAQLSFIIIFAFVLFPIWDSFIDGICQRMLDN